MKKCELWQRISIKCMHSEIPSGVSIFASACERETFAHFASLVPAAAFINYCCGLGIMQIFAATHAAQLITHTYTTGGPTTERVVAF